MFQQNNATETKNDIKDPLSILENNAVGASWEVETERIDCKTRWAV